MKKITFFLIAFLCVWKLNAQVLYPEVMSCFGGTAQNSTVQLTWTAGEPLYETVSNNSGILTQGFNQVVYITTFTEIKEVSGFTINAYPNPVQSIVNISLIAEKHTKFNLKVVDLQGNTIYNIKTANDFEQIDVSNFTAGVYFLNISDNKQIIKTFKIIKIN